MFLIHKIKKKNIYIYYYYYYYYHYCINYWSTSRLCVAKPTKAIITATHDKAKPRNKIKHSKHSRITFET